MESCMEHKLKIAMLTTKAAIRFRHGLRFLQPEGNLRLLDPITFDTMCDPVKCNDGRTYDRWTIIDNSITQSPFTRRPLAIAVDDVDVRSSLFPAFPEQEAKFRAKRDTYRAKALQHFHDHPLQAEAAVEMLNNVLQWTPDDTECRNELGKILSHISNLPCHLNGMPEENESQAPDFNLIPEVSGGSQTTAIRILRHRLRRQRDNEGHVCNGVAERSDRGHTRTIPVISHDDLIRERYGDRRIIILLIVFCYFGVCFFLSENPWAR